MHKITLFLLLTSISFIQFMPSLTHAEYNPTTGRFLQRDPIDNNFFIYDFNKISNPIIISTHFGKGQTSTNAYYYVLSNPLINIDPYGTVCVSIWRLIGRFISDNLINQPNWDKIGERESWWSTYESYSTEYLIVWYEVDRTYNVVPPPTRGNKNLPCPYRGPGNRNGEWPESYVEWLWAGDRREVKPWEYLNDNITRCRDIIVKKVYSEYMVSCFCFKCPDYKIIKKGSEIVFKRLKEKTRWLKSEGLTGKTLSRLYRYMRECQRKRVTEFQMNPNGLIKG